MLTFGRPRYRGLCIAVVVMLALCAAGCGGSAAPVSTSAANSPRILIATAGGETWRLVEEPLTQGNGFVVEKGFFMLYDPSGATAGGAGLTSPWSRVIQDVLYQGKFFIAARGAVTDNVSHVEIVAASGATLSATAHNGISFVVTSDPAFVTDSPGCASVADPFPTATCQQSFKVVALRYFSRTGTMV